MSNKMHRSGVTESIDLPLWHRESSSLSEARLFTANVAAELIAYEAATQPAKALRKQLETLDTRQFMHATAEQTRFAHTQLGAASSMLELQQIQHHTDVINAGVMWESMSSLARADATLSARQSAVKTAAGLGAFDSYTSAAAKIGLIGSLSADEAAVSAAAGLEMFEPSADAATKLGLIGSLSAHQSFAGDATGLGAFSYASPAVNQGVFGPLSTYQSAASAAAVLGTFDSSTSATAKQSLIGSLNSYESTNSAAVGMGAFDSLASATAKQGIIASLNDYKSTASAAAGLAAFDSFVGSAAKLREADAVARAKTRMDILDLALLDRTRAIEGILAPSKSAAMYLKEMSGVTALQLAVNQIENWSIQHEKIANSLAIFNEPIGVSSARDFLESMALTRVQYGLNKLFEEPSHFLNSEEVREEANHLLQDVTDAVSRASTAQEAIHQIVQAIQATKEPRSQILLFTILVPVLMAIIFSLVNPVMDFYVKKWLEGTPKQEATKQVKETAREAVRELRMLADYKFVTKQRLDIRSGPRAKAPVVGYLLFGQTVRIIEKERDFTLVSWRSDDGKVELQGWVFSRYLQRFN